MVFGQELLVIEDAPGNFRGLLFSVEEGPAAMALTAGSDEPYAVSVLPLPCPPSVYNIPAGLLSLVRSRTDVSDHRQLPSPLRPAGSSAPFPSIGEDVFGELWIKHDLPWSKREPLEEDINSLGTIASTDVLVAANGDAVLAVARKSSFGVLAVRGKAAVDLDIQELIGPGRIVRDLASFPAGADGRTTIGVLSVAAEPLGRSPRVDFVTRILRPALISL